MDVEGRSAGLQGRRGGGGGQWSAEVVWRGSLSGQQTSFCPADRLGAYVSGHRQVVSMTTIFLQYHVFWTHVDDDDDDGGDDCGHHLKKYPSGGAVCVGVVTVPSPRGEEFDFAERQSR